VPDDALNEIRAKARQAHERLLKIVDDLTDEQLAWRPAPKAHSIGFTFWHTARADDNVQADLNAADTIWDTDGYAAKWGHPAKGIGMGWDDEAAAALPLPPKAELVGYARRVFDACDAGSGLDTARFTEKRDSRFLSRETTLGDIVFTGITHDSRHLGEIEYIKGLLGLRGSVTV
jgi:DinB family protein